VLALQDVGAVLCASLQWAGCDHDAQPHACMHACMHASMHSTCHSCVLTQHVLHLALLLTGNEAFYRQPYHQLRHPMVFYYVHPAVLYVNKFRVAGLLDEGIDQYIEQVRRLPLLSLVLRTGIVWASTMTRLTGWSTLGCRPCCGIILLMLC